MAEHEESPACGCMECKTRARGAVGVCAVHLVAEPDKEPPAAVRDLALCVACEQRLRDDLRLIVDRWDEAQEALHPGRGGASVR